LVGEYQRNERQNHQHPSVRVTGPEHRALKLVELGMLARKDLEKKCATEINGRYGDQEWACDSLVASLNLALRMRMWHHGP
jgi:hypothetical protein